MFLSDLVSNIQSSAELQNVCVQYLYDTGTVCQIVIILALETQEEEEEAS